MITQTPNLVLNSFAVIFNICGKKLRNSKLSTFNTWQEWQEN